jgi:hypothetical protein
LSFIHSGAKEDEEVEEEKEELALKQCTKDKDRWG